MEQKYPCPCCGKETLSEQPPGTYEICSRCGWEDDFIQFDDPNYRGGANDLSLNEYRTKYFGLGRKKLKSSRLRRNIL